MTYPNPYRPDDDPFAEHGGQQPYPSVPQPYSYQQPVPPQQPSPYGQPVPGYGQGQPPAYPYGVDPSAPFGRDPRTGEPLSDKSKVAAGLLQFFLGMFGIGRFYIGSTAIGVAQLLLFIVGLISTIFFIGLFILFGLSIWVLVDAIMMFTGNVRDGQGRVLRD
ncbi:TM2 domain-containing protein [Williamsia sterculiae]|uniref:TM2 domain-containing membrane protein YozV n=1 Tax=Williamsia sterculiae TaxID=1344003 RepID=A0A1N7GSH2_9NOCA|nr:TM2 domain-containing protein [Williamsia sterculiae]SIS15499.1 TM2 domain-containing membrane protein YozV [Williamsia sterculiae]